KIGVHPNLDGLAFAFFPIPVRKQMQDWVLSPPSLVIVEVVFGKTAHVHNAELRVDGRPAVRGWLPAVIESGPGKSASQPFPRCVESPPLFGEFRPRGVAHII